MITLAAIFKILGLMALLMGLNAGILQKERSFRNMYQERDTTIVKMDTTIYRDAKLLEKDSLLELRD